jgi:predicted RNase H-like HicB family nuclease
MTLNVKIEQAALDGGYVAWVKELPGCVSEGDTVQEAIDNVIDAAVSYLEVKYTRGSIHVEAVEPAGHGRETSPSRAPAHEHRRILVGMG